MKALNMANSQEDRLYELEFGVEASTLYHEWRRSALEFWAGFVRLATLIGVVLTFVTAFAAMSDPDLIQTVLAINLLVALVTSIDLTFRIDSKARLHTDLYQRFKRLQVEIARHRADAVARVDEWFAEAQMIRVDEPSVLWAVYMQAWNQVLAKRKVHPGYLRRISKWQAFFGRFFEYRPQDFPPVGA